VDTCKRGQGMNTKHTCPICNGKGTQRDTRNRVSGIAVIATACPLCDGGGCLPAPLASVALRYKRKAEWLQEQLRNTATTVARGET